MRRSLLLREQFRDSIKSEIAERTQTHQSKIASFKAAKARLAVAATPAAAPLVMLAHGDSWFDYPLQGNGPRLGETDIIVHLEAMGNPNPLIQNISHYGDATTEEMSWPKQQRMIDSLQDPANWLEAGKPDAILFSGGGNDVAGNQFCIFLNDATTSGSGLDPNRFDGVLEMVQASYEDLFLFRDKYAPNVPIFGHCYDFATPNGVHPLCAGPWLQPSLNFAGWRDPDKAKDIVHDALVAFKTMLQPLAADPKNNFVLIDTQGTLTANDWANELHPQPDGFKKIAQKFVDALRSHFSSRI